MSRRAILGAPALLPLVVALIPACPAYAGRSFDWPDWAALRGRHADHGAVLLLDETEETLGISGVYYEVRRERHVAVAILDPKRAEEWLDWDVHYSPSNRLTHLEASTWTGPDRAQKVRKEDIHDVSAVEGYALFSDSRAKRFAFPGVSEGTVIEVRYGHAGLSKYSYEEHLFAHTIPTVLSRMRLVVPAAFLGVGYGESHFDQAVRARGLSASPTKRHITRPGGEMVEFSWELRDQEAIPREPRMPPFREIAPSVRLAPGDEKEAGGARTWETVGLDYYAELLAPQVKSTREIKEIAERLTSGAKGPEEKIRAIYDFVREEIRYVAVEIGRGAWEPHPAGTVCRMRYGDCKGKVCLLLALLGEAEIPAYAALVRTRDLGPVDTLLVNLGQFNHMIAWVPLGRRGWWLDPTASECPADYLPASDQGTLALLLGPGISRLMETTVHRPEACELTTEVEGRLSETGDLRGTVRIRGTGQKGLDLRSLFRSSSASEAKTRAEWLLARRIDGGRLVDYRTGGMDSTGLDAEVALEFELPRCALEVGGELVVRGDVLAPAWKSSVFDRTERRFPIRFECLERCRDRLRIHPPDGFRPEIPAPASLAGKHRRFEQTCRADSAAAEIERTGDLVVLGLPADAYPEARALEERILAACAEPIRFRRAP
jgi:hypothetical protein